MKNMPRRFLMGAAVLVVLLLAPTFTEIAKAETQEVSGAVSEVDNYVIVVEGEEYHVVATSRLVGVERDNLASLQGEQVEITYMGPLNGGSVAVTELARVSLDPTMKPAHWVLEQPGQPPLEIPVSAGGTEALFDVFGALRGLDMQRLLAVLSDPPPHPVVIWQREASAPPDRRVSPIRVRKRK